MTQKTFERVRRIELELGVAPSHYEPGSPSAPGRSDQTQAKEGPITAAGPAEPLDSEERRSVVGL